MAVIITPESELGKELSKWEQFPNRITDTPGNPYKFRQFPQMVYQAHMRNGQARCMEVDPDPYGFAMPQAYERACLEATRFNGSCQRTVQSETEYDTARAQGWRDSPSDAIAYLEKLNQDMADAAAETAFQAKGMTAKAKQELAAADASTHEHVTDVIGTPSSRRGTDAKKKARGVAGRRPVERE